jgi:hypothetical protein
LLGENDLGVDFLEDFNDDLRSPVDCSGFSFRGGVEISNSTLFFGGVC